MEMDELIAKIGKGQKTWKDLTWDEAKRAVRWLIEEKTTPAQTGAFLLAMRLKMESVTELAAFTAAAREYVAPLAIPAGLALVDLPTYAGKQETLHATVAGALVASAAGASVLMHGHDGVTGRIGSGTVLSQMGLATDQRPDQVCEALTARGFAYLDMALYHPALARFLDLRRELGVRTLFHPVARMLNPARAGSQLIGITHPAYIEKTAEALRMLGGRRALVVRGVEGDPELSLTAVTKVLELREDRLTPFALQPRDGGFAFGTLRDMSGGPVSGHPAQEAMLLARVLKNELRGGLRDWIVLNAALVLYAAGIAPSLSAGAPLALRALESGAAARKLEDLTSARSAA